MSRKIRLSHTQSYYRDRLKTLSVLNEEYDVVIKDLGSCFVLYRDAGYVERWERLTHMGRTMNSYKAIISFGDQDLFMDIKMRTYALVILVFWLLVIVSFGVFTIFQENNYGML